MTNAPVPLPAALAVEIEPFTDDELDAAIDAIWAGEPDAIPAKVGTFELSDEGRAEWALRKLAAFEQRVREVNRQHDDWVARIEQNREEATSRLKARVQVFATALERYAVLRRQANDKDATISLPSGKLKTTKETKPSVHIGNEEALARWARTNLPPGMREKVVVDVPKLYISELRKLHLRVVTVPSNPDYPDGAQDTIVQWSATGEEPWRRVSGVYAEPPKIKPTVTPDLSR